MAVHGLSKLILFTTRLPHLFSDPYTLWRTLHANPSPQNKSMSMSEKSPGGIIVDPYGEPITVDTLPPADTVRWVPRRKAQVICAIRSGLISREEACERYAISSAELFAWEHLLDEHGLRALRVTRTQQYRQAIALTEEST